jgi:hypothetical protein
MIYLCSVYSYNADEELMEKRAQYVAKRTAEFLKEGHCVFSPIAHSHQMAVDYNLPKSFEWWMGLDFQYINASDEVWVLAMPHWRNSRGVTAEIEYALESGKEVKLIPCSDYSE